jgi:hypothetical protein
MANVSGDATPSASGSSPVAPQRQPFAHFETGGEGAEVGGGMKFGSLRGIPIGVPLYLLFALLPHTREPVVYAVGR